MPHIKSNGIDLYYEETGTGIPLIFVHEFAGDYRSWEAQVRFFSRRYRCITYSARGYFPSEVPEVSEAYSQDNAILDLLGLMDGLGLEKAHVCGLSMGSYTTVLFGLNHPGRARSLTIAGSGYGSGPARKEFHTQMGQLADQMLAEGMAANATHYTESDTRLQLRAKDPRGYQEFVTHFLEHSAVGSAYTLKGVQGQRPDITQLGDKLKTLHVPAMVMLGDEDVPGFDGSLFMKRTIPGAGFELFPRSGHAINLEEPQRFNRSLLEFLTLVDSGRWKA